MKTANDDKRLKIRIIFCKIVYLYNPKLMVGRLRDLLYYDVLFAGLNLSYQHTS